MSRENSAVFHGSPRCLDTVSYRWNPRGGSPGQSHWVKVSENGREVKLLCYELGDGLQGGVVETGTVGEGLQGGVVETSYVRGCKVE